MALRSKGLKTSLSSSLRCIVQQLTYLQLTSSTFSRSFLVVNLLSKSTSSRDLACCLCRSHFAAISVELPKSTKKLSSDYSLNLNLKKQNFFFTSPSLQPVIMTATDILLILLLFLPPASNFDNRPLAPATSASACGQWAQCLVTPEKRCRGAILQPGRSHKRTSFSTTAMN